MRTFLFAAILLMGATGAYAQLPDAYVGAGVSQARINDIFHSGHDFDLNNMAWKAFVGVRPIPFLGVEANYMDLGSESRHNHMNGPAVKAKLSCDPVRGLPNGRTEMALSNLPRRSECLDPGHHKLFGRRREVL